MNFEQLYKAAVLKNIVGWNVATEPTEDSYAVQEMVNLAFDKAMKEYIKTEPEDPISTFNKDLVFSDQLEEKKVQAAQKLWKKYLSLRQDKLAADDEYFDLFDNMVSVTKEMLASKNLSAENLMYFNDNRLGTPEFVLSVVERMANISKEFLKTKPKNTITPMKDMTFEEVIAYIEKFKDISYKISDKNGSFMTGLDRDNSRIHVAKNQTDIFDTASSVTHEVGHALYQTRVLNKNTRLGLLTQHLSLSLHESSSIIHEISLSGIDFSVKQNSDNLYRLGTDKVHYIIHIYIRMAVEKMLFTDQITARQIPQVWADLVEEYIGIRPQTDWEGFLQDVHWNDGAFGYFHSYAVGFFNAVTMYEEIKDSLTNDMLYNTEEIILKKINNWYGHYNEQSYDILQDMHADIDKSLKAYKNFVFNNFSYVS